MSKQKNLSDVAKLMTDFTIAGELALVAAATGLFPSHVLADETAAAESAAQSSESQRSPAAASESENGLSSETNQFLKDAATQVDKNFKYTAE